MKNLVLISFSVLFCLLTCFSIAQSEGDRFEVIDINEFIVSNETRKQILDFGSEFGANDQLVFQNENAQISVVKIASFGETFEVKPKPDNLRSFTFIPSESRNLRRPAKTDSYIELKAFLRDRILLILDDKVRFKVSNEEFPRDDDHFFYIRYNWSGDVANPVNKKLLSTKTGFEISRINLLRVDGQPISAEEVSDYELYYYDEQEEKSVFINRFDLVFADDKKLGKEISAIIQASKPNKPNLLYKGIEEYVNSKYGEPIRKDLRQWVKRRFRGRF